MSPLRKAPAQWKRSSCALHPGAFPALVLTVALILCALLCQDGNRKVKPVPKDEAFGAMPAPNQVHIIMSFCPAERVCRLLIDYRTMLRGCMGHVWAGAQAAWRELLLLCST